MKNERRKTKDERKLAPYVRELAEWIRAQVDRGEATRLQLGTNHVRKIREWALTGIPPFRALAEAVVTRAYRHYDRTHTAVYVVSAFGDGILDQVDLDFEFEHLRSVRSHRARQRAVVDRRPAYSVRVDPDRADVLGLEVWLLRMFGEIKVHGLRLEVRKPNSADSPSGVLASWDREDFRTYIETPEWFAPVIMDEATRDAESQATTSEYTVLAYREGEKACSRCAFLLAGGVPGLDDREPKNDPSVSRDVLDIFKRHQHAVLAMHVEFMNDMCALMKGRLAEPRGTT